MLSATYLIAAWCGLVSLFSVLLIPCSFDDLILELSSGRVVPAAEGVHNSCEHDQEDTTAGTQTENLNACQLTTLPLPKWLLTLGKKPL